MPAKAQPIAATTKESTAAGLALSAAAMPVSEKSPAPMIAPIPSATRLTAPSVFFRCVSPASASAWIRASDFVSKRDIKCIAFLCLEKCVTRRATEHGQACSHQTVEMQHGKDTTVG